MKNSIGVYLLNHNNGEKLISSFYSCIAQLQFIDEFLIIDNSSSEMESIRVLNEIENQGFRVVRRNKNSFIEACNDAIRSLNTQYIMRLDSDDILTLNALKKYKKILKADSNPLMIIPSYSTINKDGYPLNNVKKQNTQGLLPMFPPHGAVTLVNRIEFLSAGGYFTGFDRQDGFMVWLRLYSGKKTIKILEDRLFLYRQHDSNLSKDRKRLLNTRFEILKRCYPQVPKFALVFYSFPNEDITTQINDLRQLSLLAHQTYLLGDSEVEFDFITRIKRPIESMFSSKNLFRFLREKFSAYENVVLINSSYRGSYEPILSALYYAEFTKFKGKFVLVDRIDRTVYQNLDDLDHLDSEDFLVSTKTPKFLKVKGFELITSMSSEDTKIFTVENYG